MQAREAAQRLALGTLAERAPKLASFLDAGPIGLRNAAARALPLSEFLLDALCRDESWWIEVLQHCGERVPAGPFPAPPFPEGADVPEERLMADLRLWRRREFARIAWRDLAEEADLDATLGGLSAAADTALRLAQSHGMRALTARYGVPRDGRGDPQGLVIVAMGKLGGGELNFSSDIDLVALYPESGETDGSRGISNQEFFTRLVQHIVRVIGQRTADGIVFRIDLRLRPFGDSGPVVTNAAALEDYLQVHGRDWERYAWVKARPVTHAEAYEEINRSLVRPFVYRRYLDFGVFDSLRDMKALIEREVARRELAENIKLGDGGIREIEFIVQSFQLIRGGTDRRLQGNSLRQSLALLAGAKLLPDAAVAELDDAYVFLRRLENRLQMHADQQTHALPADPVRRERLAWSMQLPDWPSLEAATEAHRRRVSGHFRAVVFGGGESAPEALAFTHADPAALATRLGSLGWPEPAQTAQRLKQFLEGALRRLDAAGARRLAALLPVLLQEVRADGNAPRTLLRLLRVFESIGARSAYFALLLHNARARERLVRLASHGDFLIDLIAAHPLLLDELIDERLLEMSPDRASLAADLAQRMDGVDEEDEEQLIERLRHFQRAAVFRIAVADLLQLLPVMQVSDRLTDVAELIIAAALRLAWRQLAGRLGVPRCGEGEERRDVRLCVVGYGKLGGMELGYASDLDLVFIHDSTGARQETDGVRVVDNQVFLLRFAQRLVHMLTVHSRAGRLYEVDMRLRPSGKAGLLITGLESFADYQRNEAWTWEHQSLLHARTVAGDPELRQRFEDLRLELLSHAVRRDRLRQDVRHMRNRQRNELSRAGKGEFDLKQDAGGIGDVEFLAQYWALLWAAKYPPVAMFADTIRQLESVASADLVPQARVDVLSRIYRAYRARLHHRSLEGLGAVVPAEEFAAERAEVCDIWEDVMGD